MAYLGQVLSKGALNQNVKKKKEESILKLTQSWWYLLFIIVFYHPGKWAENIASVLQGKTMETWDSKSDMNKISQLAQDPN